MIRTKTIATIGPASRSAEMLEKLVAAGVDCLRLNFSHGTLQQHGEVLQTIRQLAEKRQTPLAVLGDLCGPKIRLDQIDPQRAQLPSDGRLILQKEPILGNNQRVSCSFPDLIDEVEPGDRLLIDDGNILLLAEERKSGELICHCVRGGLLSDHKGINLPDTDLSTPALTAKDEIDLRWAAENQLDYLAVSFVRRPEDLQLVRQKLAALNSPLAVVSKIEKPQAITHLAEIIALSDAIMVARGDLGVEMELAQVPLLQKRIIRECQRAGKPVIVATQMLQSMVSSAVPTRAEVSDVANAIYDTADAVMLSAESAVGQYPVEVVATMNRIAAETENYLRAQPDVLLPEVAEANRTILAALVRSARSLASQFDCKLIAAWTQSGVTARLLSKHRFRQPIIALTANPLTRNQLALNYGVWSVCTPMPSDTLDMLRRLDDIVTAQQWARPGDTIVVLTGTHFAHSGANNALLIHQVGDL
ncbi:MAG: Pyruvate kinase [Phycisphaerae bacterium]|nr:Pyruvate kinase [Phycisphaerae bacterium]